MVRRACSRRPTTRRARDRAMGGIDEVLWPAGPGVADRWSHQAQGGRGLYPLGHCHAAGSTLARGPAQRPCAANRRESLRFERHDQPIEGTRRRGRDPPRSRDPRTGSRIAATGQGRRSARPRGQFRPNRSRRLPRTCRGPRQRHDRWPRPAAAGSEAIEKSGKFEAQVAT